MTQFEIPHICVFYTGYFFPSNWKMYYDVGHGFVNNYKICRRKIVRIIPKNIANEHLFENIIIIDIRDILYQD